MSGLLAMYQKFRLIREQNQLTLDLTKYTSGVDRISKQIERTQKRYTSLFAQLESQAKMMQSQANVYFQNMAGLGSNTASLSNYTGLNGFVCNIVGGMLSKGGFKYKDEHGKEKPLEAMSNSEIQKMMNEYAANGRFLPKLDENNQPIQNEYANGWTPQQVAAFTTAMRAGQMQQQQAQMWSQNASQNYTNNVSVWLDYQKAQLEAEQDAALEPLNYKETMMELDKTQAETKLKRIEAQIQSYDQLISQEAQNSAPKFGLG